LAERRGIEGRTLSRQREVKLVFIETSREQDRGKSFILDWQADEIIVSSNPPVAGTGLALDLEERAGLEKATRSGINALRAGMRRLLSPHSQAAENGETEA
jgi:hypothetical protein